MGAGANRSQTALLTRGPKHLGKHLLKCQMTFSKTCCSTWVIPATKEAEAVGLSVSSGKSVRLFLTKIRKDGGRMLA